MSQQYSIYEHVFSAKPYGNDQGGQGKSLDSLAHILGGKTNMYTDETEGGNRMFY